jgi:hypothetical protein
VAYQPGVVYGAGAEQSPVARRSGDSGGWQRTPILSGGVAFNGLPTIEQLGEFKVINNTFSAEYGRTGGGIESLLPFRWQPIMVPFSTTIQRLERQLGWQCQWDQSPSIAATVRCRRQSCLDSRALT